MQISCTESPSPCSYERIIRRSSSGWTNYYRICTIHSNPVTVQHPVNRVIVLFRVLAEKLP